MNWKTEKRILLVEDNAKGEFFKDYLSEIQGLNVDWSVDVDDAWGLANTHDYDLFILDVMMPLSEDSILYKDQQRYNLKNEFGMFTGLLLLIKLQLEIGCKRDFKTILFTARGQQQVDVELESLKVGVTYDHFVSKADEPIKLYRTIETVLR